MEEHRINVLIVGPILSGKSTIFKHLIQDDLDFDVHTDKEHIYPEFYERKETIEGKKLAVQLLDVPTPSFSLPPTRMERAIKRSNCVMIVYELGSEESMRDVREWLVAFREFGDDRFAVLLGNKCDMNPDDGTCKLLAEEYKIPSFITSGCTGENVRCSFENVLQQYVDAIE
eukprot:TRINITY_DN3517_c0_g1_i1.p1 TRINITY_DN3517_c0_g1~~TRINITY_DN3517_c0_g1_i1.p1  ORF type:complete len:172 (-),score=33.53 TRINITY_DN3517_c0_g1_i1:100-615(-)